MFTIVLNRMMNFYEAFTINAETEEEAVTTAKQASEKLAKGNIVVMDNICLAYKKTGCINVTSVDSVNYSATGASIDIAKCTEECIKKRYQSLTHILEKEHIDERFQNILNDTGLDDDGEIILNCNGDLEHDKIKITITITKEKN